MCKLWISFLNLDPFLKIIKTSITALHCNIRTIKFWKNIRSSNNCILNEEICLFIIHIGISVHNDPSKQTAVTANPPPISHEVFCLWNNISIFGWVNWFLFLLSNTFIIWLQWLGSNFGYPEFPLVSPLALFSKGDPKSRNGGMAEWRKMTPNPKTWNGRNDLKS